MPEDLNDGGDELGGRHPRWFTLLTIAALTVGVVGLLFVR